MEHVGVQVVLIWCPMLVLCGVVMVCLVMALCVCEPHVVFLFSSGDFGACCGFPFVHGVGNFVPVVTVTTTVCLT